MPWFEKPGGSKNWDSNSNKVIFTQSFLILCLKLSTVFYEIAYN